MGVYQHFRAEEKPFIERITEYAETVQERYQSVLTNFLDPREQFIVQAVVGRLADIKVVFFGGYEQAERKRALIIPDFFEVSPEDFKVTLLSIAGSYKSPPFEHRDVLGSVLGLGLKREKLGDILISDEAQQCIVAEEIAPFISAHLQQIHRTSVQCETISLEQIQPSSESWSFKETTVSSLRLDAILAELLSISRSKAVPLIKAGKVKVNWRVVEQISMLLDEGDVLSVKGYGRFLFAKVEGRTRKERLRVQLGRKP